MTTQEEVQKNEGELNKPADGDQELESATETSGPVSESSGEAAVSHTAAASSSNANAEEPVAEDSGSDEPGADELVPEESVAEEPVAEEPVVEEPVAEESVVEESVAEESVAEEPVAEESVTEEPVAEESVTEEPVAEEPVAEEPVAEEPVAEEPVAEEPVAEEPVAEEPVAEEPVAEQASAPSAASDNQEAASGKAEEDEDDGESTRVVRMLAVGQQVEGVVKRIADFGAFVDIGVGRDGLLHISELSLQRVGKVADVLSPNQEIKPWIKKLDRERNRISLTLIDPDQKTIRDLQTGEIVSGTVTRILPYGAFIDIGIGRDALLHVREMSNKYVEKPEDVVQVGESLDVRVIEVSRRRGRVDLSIKGLRDEPEDEAEAAEVTLDEEIEEVEDEFADVEVLSPMELAFKRAVEAEGDEIRVEKKRGNSGRKSEARAIQDEIIARTLDSGRK